jgi:hypothetical protein
LARSPVRLGCAPLLRLDSCIGAAHAATSTGTATTAKWIVLADQAGKLRQRVGVAAPRRTTPAWIQTIQIIREGPILETICHRAAVSPFGLAANSIQNGPAFTGCPHRPQI